MNLNLNLEKIKSIIGHYKLQVGYKQTGYASIDRPWDKNKTEINVPDENCYENLLHRSKINSSPILARCHEDKLDIDRLKKESLEYAKSFTALGVKKGDIIPICTQSTIEAIIMFFALNRIGAVTTFLNPTANKEEIKSYIKKYNSKNIVISSKYSSILSDLVNECNLNKEIVVSTKDSIFNALKMSDLTKEYIESTTKEYVENDNIISLKSFKKLGNNIELDKSYKSSKSDEALICYTSGSTGDPKAIVLTNENIIAEIMSLKKTTLMQLGPMGNSLQVVPFYYPYGFIISTLFPMYVGKSAALTPILTIKNIREYIEMYKPRYIQAIPSFYKYLIQSYNLKNNMKNFDLSFLKYAVSGGDTLDIVLKKDIMSFFKKHGSNAKICDGSGNGEGCGCLTTSVVGLTHNYYSVGKPLIGTDVKIVDPDTGVELQYGQVGKFCFSGDNLMKTYFDTPDKTLEVKYIDKDGKMWFHTDTYAHMDEKGWLYIDGRERRFFITYDESGSPYKVYCEKVQPIIKRHPMVLDCVVTGTLDFNGVRDLVPKAYIVLKPGTVFTDELEKEINEICEQFLQKCAIPVEYEIIDNIPLTKAGKTDYKYFENQQQEQVDSKKMIKKYNG